jgi:tetrahydromethanopterin S-methyltransferase subunit E
MIKISSITFLGFLITLIGSPLISISRTWKEVLSVLAGLGIIVLSFLIRRELHRVVRALHGLEEIKSDTYVENNPQ